MKKTTKGSKKIYILFLLFLFFVNGSLFVANAEVSLPNPSLPNPSLPNPSLPNTSLPNPSLSDSNLSNPSLPGIDVESSEGGGNEDGTSNGEDKGWIDSLTDFAQSVGDKLDSFTQNAIDTIGDIGSSILDGLAEAGQWIADNWEFTAAVVAGVGLTIAGIFVAPLLPFGLAILAGIAISGGIGYFTGLRGEDLTKEMGIGGALGAIGGGVLGIVGKVAGTGLKTLVTGSALSGAISSMADDTLHNRKLSIPKAVIGAVLGVGLTVLLVGGTGLANKLINPGQVAKPTVSSQKVDVPDEVGKGSGTVVSEGIGNGKVHSFKPGYDTHLIEVEDVVRKGNKGIVGGHNLVNFEKAFTDRGWSLAENIISKTPHPTIKGVYEVKYRIPALDKMGNIIPGQYKNIPNPKTVYDPSVISNEQMLKWGQEAMANATVNGRIITGISSNGLKFQGYINNGEITNFFPTIK